MTAVKGTTAGCVKVFGCSADVITSGKVIREKRKRISVSFQPWIESGNCTSSTSERWATVAMHMLICRSCGGVRVVLRIKRIDAPGHILPRPPSYLSGITAGFVSAFGQAQPPSLLPS